MIIFKEKLSEATEEGKRLKLRLCLEVDKACKVTLGGTQSCSVASILAQLCVL